LNRKLLILDVVLGAGVIYGGFQLHSEWVAARARQAAMPGPAPKAGPIPAVAPLAQQPPVMPSGYKEIAINTLFDPSRTPDVVQPPPPPPPPPPEPPPLPSFHGMMDLGDPQGPIALMTEKDKPRHEEVHAGETIGAFKLLSFDRQEMSLEWQGRVIRARLSDGGSQPRAAKAGVPPINDRGIIPGVAAPEPLEPPPPPPQGQTLGPGMQVTESTRACQPNDSTPAGTVADGYQKVVRRTPLGTSQCFWLAAGK